MVVSVHDIHASVLASAGEEDYDMNLLELPGDGEKDNVCIQTKLKGEPNGEIYLSFSRKKVPKGAFAGRLHVTVHRVEGFRDKSGLLGRTDPFVSVKLGAGKPRQTEALMCQVSTCVGFHVSGKHTCQGGSTHERKHEAQRKHRHTLRLSCVK